MGVFCGKLLLTWMKTKYVCHVLWGTQIFALVKIQHITVLQFNPIQSRKEKEKCCFEDENCYSIVTGTLSTSVTPLLTDTLHSVFINYQLSFLPREIFFFKFKINNYIERQSQNAVHSLPEIWYELKT